MSSTTAGQTINVLRELFGITQQLVSDNSSQFVSEEFKQFMIANGVKHIRSLPYHPASNGAVERMVQTLKLALKADNKRGVPIEKSLANLLLHYRVTPHATTGVPPCTLMTNHGLRTPVDMLKPNIASKVHSKQAYQKYYSDKSTCPREFANEQEVILRNFREGNSWIRDKIVNRLGPVSYLVQCHDGAMWRRHVDHIQETAITQELSDSTSANQDSDEIFMGDSTPEVTSINDKEATPSDSVSDDVVNELPTSSSSSWSSQDLPMTRYSRRVTKPPDHYM